MTGGLWLPSLVILAAGALVGWYLSRRLAGAAGGHGGSRRKTAESDTAPADALATADFLHLRDELYGRLRAPDLDAAERRRLEIRAAKVLKALDEAGALDRPVEQGGRGADKADSASRKPTGPPAAPDSRREPAPVHSGARHALGGFVLGGGLVALIAVLIFWAGRDAQPRPADPGIAPMATGSGEGPAHPEASLPPEVQAEAESLLAAIEANPEDLGPRKRLALLYLASDQYVPAFQEARAIQEIAPDDIDAIYVEGVVRMTMGQDQEAAARLDRVLELFPGHVRAMTVKGIVLARSGDLAGARSLWETALEIGGPRPEVQNLIAMLDAQEAGELPADHPQVAGQAPPAANTGGGRDGAGAGPGEPMLRAGSAGDVGETDAVGPRGAAGYPLELRWSGDVPDGSVVFLALRGAAGGPSIAVRRIVDPRFPLRAILSSADSMMGAELPEQGLLSARLDTDGSASTRDPGDLAATAEVELGRRSVLELAPEANP